MGLDPKTAVLKPARVAQVVITTIAVDNPMTIIISWRKRVVGSKGAALGLIWTSDCVE
jgi:hypothetical protein